MKRQNISWWQQKISLVQSLSWIVLSILIFTGGGFSITKACLEKKHYKNTATEYAVQVIVQTGPEKESLKSLYLCELLGLSADLPVNVFHVEEKDLENKLLASPLIKSASVQLMKPDTIYVDYTVRKPIAWLYDFQNTFVDEEGYLFPVSPFFSPKKIPEIYLGMSIFPGWQEPVVDEKFSLAVSILQLLSTSIFDNAFFVKRVDVSLSQAPSYGKREVVLHIEEQMISKEEGREVRLVFPMLLRLNTKSYSQELINYLELRNELLREDKIQPVKQTIEEKIFPLKTIDFRISQLAYIKE